IVAVDDEHPLPSAGLPPRECVGRMRLAEATRAHEQRDRAPGEDPRLQEVAVRLRGVEEDRYWLNRSPGASALTGRRLHGWWAPRRGRLHQLLELVAEVVIARTLGTAPHEPVVDPLALGEPRQLGESDVGNAGPVKRLGNL